MPYESTMFELLYKFGLSCTAKRVVPLWVMIGLRFSDCDLTYTNTVTLVWPH